VIALGLALVLTLGGIIYEQTIGVRSRPPMTPAQAADRYLAALLQEDRAALQALFPPGYPRFQTLADALGVVLSPRIDVSACRVGQPARRESSTPGLGGTVHQVALTFPNPCIQVNYAEGPTVRYRHIVLEMRSIQDRLYIHAAQVN
jgi:hypothetical protein